MPVATLPLTVANTHVVEGPHVQRLTDSDQVMVWRRPAMSAHAARNEVRGARRRGYTVHVHRITDRSGTDVLVALVRYPDGVYDGITYLVDVYEIPVNALLDL